MNDNKIIMSIADIRAMCLALSYEEVFTYLMKNTIIATDNLAADWMIRFGAEYIDPRSRIDVYEKTIATWQSENPAATLIALKQRWPNAASNITQGLAGDKKAINNVIKDCFVNNVESKARLQDKFDNSPEATVINSVIKHSLQEINKENEPKQQIKDDWDNYPLMYSDFVFLARRCSYKEFSQKVLNSIQSSRIIEAKEFRQIYLAGSELVRFKMYLRMLKTDSSDPIKINGLKMADIKEAGTKLCFSDFCVYVNLVLTDNTQKSEMSEDVYKLLMEFSAASDKKRHDIFAAISTHLDELITKEENSDIIEEYNYLTITEIANVADRLHYKDFCNYIYNIKYNQITSPALRFLTRFNAFSEEDKHKKWLELKGIDSELEQKSNTPKTNYIIPMKIKFSGILRQAEVLPDFDAFRNNIIDLHTHSCRCTDKVEVFMFEFVSANLEKQKNMYLDCQLKATKKSSPKELFDLICLVKKFPNDQELGAAIRAQLQFYPTR